MTIELFAGSSYGSALVDHRRIVCAGTYLIKLVAKSATDRGITVVGRSAVCSPCMRELYVTAHVPSTYKITSQEWSDAKVCLLRAVQVYVMQSLIHGHADAFIHDDLDLPQHACVFLFQESARCSNNIVCVYVCAHTRNTVTCQNKEVSALYCTHMHICMRCIVSTSLSWRCCFNENSKPV